MFARSNETQNQNQTWRAVLLLKALTTQKILLALVIKKFRMTAIINACFKVQFFR